MALPVVFPTLTTAETARDLKFPPVVKRLVLSVSKGRIVAKDASL